MPSLEEAQASEALAATAGSEGLGSAGDDAEENSARDAEQAGVPGALGMELRWEPLAEGEPRPVLPRQEYARLLTASRRRARSGGREVGGAWRSSWPAQWGGLRPGE